MVNRGGTAKLPISPLVGEMPGRAEGGVKDRQRSVHIESPSRAIPRARLRLAGMSAGQRPPLSCRTSPPLG
ncbi:MAG: hypothetical protein EOS82_32440, partial [Mesorhizobium sp.]